MQTMSTSPDRERRQRLGELIREARAMQGATQSAAARKAGLSRDRWTLYEKGDVVAPRPETLSKIDKAVGWEQGSAVRFLREGSAPQRQVTVYEGSDALAVLADITRELSADERGELAAQLRKALDDWRARAKSKEKGADADQAPDEDEEEVYPAN